MTWLSGKHLVWLASAVLITCAVLHSMAWGKTQAMFPAGMPQRMAALVWFLLPIDWIVFAILWAIAVGNGPAMKPLLLVSAIVPAAVAVGLGLVLGWSFFAIYLQLAAIALLLVGTLRLA